MSNKYIYILLVLLVVAIDVVGDYLLKKWAIGSNFKFLLLGLSLFMIANLFWALSMKYELLSKVMIFYSVLGVVAGVLVGVLIFKESLNIANWVGFLMALVSLILINL